MSRQVAIVTDMLLHSPMPGHVITAASCSLLASQVVAIITARPVVVFITARPVVVFITARPVAVFITARPVVVFITARPVVVFITARPVVVFITTRPVVVFIIGKSSCCDHHFTSRCCLPSRSDHHVVAVVPLWPFDGAIITAGVRG